MSDRLTGAKNALVADSAKTKSARGKIWAVPESKPIDEALIAAAGGSKIIAALLKARGVENAEAAKMFLDSEHYQMTSPMELPDVDRVVVRVAQAIRQQEHITVYGDYDVDGVTGTSVLLTVLKRLGASVDYYIPNRGSEGYGLNLKAVSILASKHRTKLIITCDCGVSNFSEINLARSLGVDTIVLDHHSMPELLPPACAIVHPKRLPEDHPLYHLPGVGVAYKACEALLIDSGLDAEVDELLDYVCLGMIADLVPLVKENRHLVRAGLPRLVNSKRPGIQALLAQVKMPGDTDLVAFGLAPRINAVGRLADARAAVELMTTNDAGEAENLARQLQLENSRRQEICEQIFKEADQMVREKLDMRKERSIAIFKEGWHHGVVGIVASRLVEKYNRPVFIGELDGKENMVKGSARGVEGIDLYQVLKKNEHLLTRWGGHKMAAGWGTDADRADVLCRALMDTCNSMLAEDPLIPVLHIDACAQPAEVDLSLAKDLLMLAPFGMGNKKPVLMLRSLTCAAARVLGKEGKHHRIMLEDGKSNGQFEAVMWNSQGAVPAPGDIVDIAFTPEVNTFNGRDRLQLVLSDWRRESDGADISLNLMITERKLNEAPAVVPESAETDHVAPQPATVASDAQRVIRSQMSIWKELRSFPDSRAILTRAAQKLGSDMSIFAETEPPVPGFNFVDRTALAAASNLIIWQAPPSMQVLKEILVKTGAKNVYFLGHHQTPLDEPSNFLKHLFGLVKFAVNKKGGEVHAEKLTAALGTSKMAAALGLTVFRKLHVIDWYAEDGILFLDLIGAPEGQPEDLAEFRQLSDALAAVREFRQWCADSPLKEIQLAVSPNHIELADDKKQMADCPETEEAREVVLTDECDE